MSQATRDDDLALAHPPERVRQAAQYLRELLDRPGHYRDCWMMAAHRDTAELNQAAIAQVLAEYMWEVGEVDDTVTDLPRKLRSKVSRALNGQVLTAKVLTLFIDAFHMSEDDAGRLRGLLAGSGTIKLLGSDFEVPVLRRYHSNHETISVHESHYLGPDGLPATHRTVQSIRATQPMDRYPYVFDTNAVTIEVNEGGTPGPTYQVGDGLYAVDIELTTPLAAGGTASLVYVSTFRYREPPPTEFRRAVGHIANNVTLRVQFHPARLPSHLWHATWTGLDSPATLGDEASLDAEYSAHRFYERPENQLVGLVWEW
jgi:hypothetical protein